MKSSSGAVGLCVVRDRRRVLGALFRAACAAAAGGGLQGCGGGDDGGGAPPSPAPVPSPPAPSPMGPIAAQMSVPTPVGYDADRRAAFDRLNALRLSAGLGMLVQDALLDQAAQAHAAWIVANDSLAHVEPAGSPGFTGAHWWDRAEALGYVPAGGDELIAGELHGAPGVDALVNALYHRAGLLAVEPVDVGIGWTAGEAARVSMPLVIEVTQPGADAVRGRGQQMQQGTGGLSVWPIDGAGDVPLALGLESPNPVPSQDVLSLGTPVSVCVAAGLRIEVDTFVLSTVATHAVIAGQRLTAASDPNGLPASFASLVPLAVLAPDTAYRVAFTGSSVDGLSGVRQAVERTWTFTTAGA